MSLLPGSVVMSKCGRDEGRIFCVVGCEGAQVVLLADGRRRRSEKPKRKKIKHLTVLAAVNEAAAISAGTAGNYEVKQIIKTYLKGLTPNREG